MQEVPGSLAYPNADLGPKKEDEPRGDWLFGATAGFLLWFSTMTRPDMANAVRAVASHAHDPSARHWKTVLGILEYLNGTRGFGLTFEKDFGMTFPMYANADYAHKSS